MTQSSFYADGEIYDTAVVESNDVPASTTPTTAPSGFYPGGSTYDALRDEGTVLADMTALKDAAVAAKVAAEAADADAITQAGTATAQAVIATTKAGEASTSAGTATTQAGIATTKAGEASTSAGTATTQAGIATTKAGDANTSAGNAATSEANALSYKNTALTYLNDFKGRYYGALATDPALDPLGAAVNAGDMYWNTTSTALKIYNGTTWALYSAATVLTIFGRSGAVTAQTGDYTFAQIGSKPTTISGYGITDTLTNTVFGRSGTVTAQTGDYTFAQIGSKPTTISGYGITDSISYFTVSQQWNRQQYYAIGTIADSTTLSWNVLNDQKAKVTLGGNRTMNAVSNAVEGATYYLWVIQDATGSRTLSWTTTGSGAFDFGTPGAPTLTTTANKADLLCFEAMTINSTLKLRYIGIQKGFS
jgi:hypothetical protein